LRAKLDTRPRSTRWVTAIRWARLQSRDRRSWNNENGPAGGDEINVIKAGGNYGWPEVSFGRDYSGPQIVNFKDGMIGPIVFWAPSIAPSGMAFYTGSKFPDWKNNVLVGAQLGGTVPGYPHLSGWYSTRNG
jgi:glucose/arabinose dehydrogenase